MAFDVGRVFIPQTLEQAELLYVSYPNAEDCRLPWYDAVWWLDGYKRSWGNCFLPSDGV